MKRKLTLWRRIAAGIIGVVYAVIYGFWTLFITGGGHGNFIWFFLFFFAGLFGIYYPLMAIFAVDLREKFIRTIFGGLIAIHLVTSLVMIVGWASESGSTERTDFMKTINAIGYGGVILCAALHFFPTLVFSMLLLRAIKGGEAVTDELIEIRLS